MKPFYLKRFIHIANSPYSTNFAHTTHLIARPTYAYHSRLYHYAVTGFTNVVTINGFGRILQSEECR